METLTKVNHEEVIQKATEKARDAYNNLLQKARINIDKILGFPYNVEKTHDEIKIFNRLAVVNLEVDGEETKFQGIKFAYTKTLYAHTKNYVSLRIEYSFEVHNGGVLTIVDKIEDVDNGLPQYNMSKFEITRDIHSRLHKLGLTILNF
jgi:hypothetical protein